MVKGEPVPRKAFKDHKPGLRHIDIECCRRCPMRLSGATGLWSSTGPRAAETLINAKNCLANSSQRLGFRIAPGLPRFDFGVVSSFFAPFGAILRAQGARLRITFF